MLYNGLGQIGWSFEVSRRLDINLTTEVTTTFTGYDEYGRQLSYERLVHEYGISDEEEVLGVVTSTGDMVSMAGLQVRQEEMITLLSGDTAHAHYFYDPATTIEISLSTMMTTISIDRVTESIRDQITYDGYLDNVLNYHEISFLFEGGDPDPLETETDVWGMSYDNLGRLLEQTSSTSKSRTGSEQYFEGLLHTGTTTVRMIDLSVSQQVAVLDGNEIIVDLGWGNISVSAQFSTTTTYPYNEQIYQVRRDIEYDQFDRQIKWTDETNNSDEEILLEVKTFNFIRDDKDRERSSASVSIQKGEATEDIFLGITSTDYTHYILHPKNVS